jgi:hypothetical protein
MTEVDRTFEQIVVTRPQALLVVQPESFFLLEHQDGRIAEAKKVLEDLRASIADEVQLHMRAIEALHASISGDEIAQQQIISAQEKEQQQIKSACPHKDVRLLKE